MLRKLLLLSLAAAASLSLLACSGDDDRMVFGTEVVAGADAVACGSASTSTIVLDIDTVQVTEDWPLPDPAGTHFVDVSGTVLGLGAGESVYGVLVDTNEDCPVAWTDEATPTAGGAFTLRLRILTLDGLLITNFRIVALTGPAGSTPACDAGGTCIGMTAGAAATGISNAIAVQLD